MKVKVIARKFEMTNSQRLYVYVSGGGLTDGMHSFSKNAVKEMLEENAPIMNRTVKSIEVTDGRMIVTAV